MASPPAGTARRNVLVAALLVVLAALVSTFPVDAQAACPGSPKDVADARGYTFLGTVTKWTSDASVEPPLRFVTFDVTTVYTGATNGTRGEDPRPGDGRLNEVLRAGHALTVSAPTGDGIRNLRVGTRYLVSGSSIDTALQCDHVAWRIADGSARFVKMSDERGDSRFSQVRTLDEAVALMAPDAALPPTSTAATLAPPGGINDAIPLIALLSAAMAVVLSVVRLRQRLAS